MDRALKNTYVLTDDLYLSKIFYYLPLVFNKILTFYEKIFVSNTRLKVNVRMFDKIYD